MAIIDLAIPLDGQPRYLDVLRADVPFRFVYVPPLGRVSLASPATWFDARGSGLLGRTGPSGNAVYSPGITNAERWTGIETGPDFTVIALVRDSSGRGTNRNPIDADNNSGVGRNWQFRIGTTNRLEFFVFNTALSVFGTGPTATTSATDPSVMVGRVSNGVVNSWLNGIGGTPVTITGTQQTLLASELLAVGGRVDHLSAVSQFFGGDIYGLFVIAGALPEGLIQSFTSPDKVWAWAFEPREIQVFVPASGAPVLIAATPGNAVAAGVQARINQARQVTGTAGNAVANGVAARVNQARTVVGTAGNATAAGITARIDQARRITGSAGNAVADGETASIYLGRLITAAPGDAAAAGVTATIFSGAVIQATPGNAVAAGRPATILGDQIIVGNAGNATAVGVSAQVGQNRQITGNTANATAEGLLASIYVGVTVQATPAVAVADGVDATLLQAITISATAGNAVAAGRTARIIEGDTPIYAAIPASRKARGRFGERPAQLSTGRRR